VNKNRKKATKLKFKALNGYSRPSSVYLISKKSEISEDQKLRNKKISNKLVGIKENYLEDKVKSSSRKSFDIDKIKLEKEVNQESSSSEEINQRMREIVSKVQ